MLHQSSLTKGAVPAWPEGEAVQRLLCPRPAVLKPYTGWHDQLYDLAHTWASIILSIPPHSSQPVAAEHILCKLATPLFATSSTTHHQDPHYHLARTWGTGMLFFSAYSISLVRLSRSHSLQGAMTLMSGFRE